MRWEGLPAGIEEMELLVSLDGGHAFARVADLEPSDGSYAWLVPSLPAGRAVLAIRGLAGGRETLVFVSGAFAIDAAGARELQPLSWRGGELWTDAAGSPAPIAPGLAEPRESARALPSEQHVAQGPSPAADAAPEPSHDDVRADEESAAPSVPASRSRSPLVFPRRN